MTRTTAARPVLGVLVALAVLGPGRAGTAPPSPVDVPIGCPIACTSSFASSLAAAEPQPNDPQARPRWTPAVEVEPGDALCIVAEGSVFDGDDGDMCGGTAGPGGTGCAMGVSGGDWLTGVSHLALIGRIRLGTVPESYVLLDDGSDISGTGVYGPGFVGSIFRALVPVGGTLELSINDNSAGDNAGAFSVSVCRGPRCNLLPNEPDPFCVTEGSVFATRIRFALALASSIRLEILQADGTTPVRLLVDGMHNSGQYEVAWDGRDDSAAPVADGSYLCRLTAQECVSERTLTVRCGPTAAAASSWSVIKRTFGER